MGEGAGGRCRGSQRRQRGCRRECEEGDSQDCTTPVSGAASSQGRQGQPEEVTRSQRVAEPNQSAGHSDTPIMTRTLDAAIAKLAVLPPDEQDRVGRWLLDELADDEQWARKFETSQHLLSKLAAEVRADQTGGRATDVDPDRL